jgi:DNA processing protein
VAVLGTGIDLAYPSAHRLLRARIARHGLLLSELPPGMRSHGWAFPRRNRLIAALSRLTVVVEAGLKSGARITADVASDLDRQVGAVPGPIDSPQSEGTNRMLRDGAQVIASVEDALALIGATLPVRSAPQLDTPAEARVWDVLKDGPGDLDALCARSALPVAECMQAVTALELRGAVECALTGEIRRR